jgi:hypothetical protein
VLYREKFVGALFLTSTVSSSCDLVFHTFCVKQENEQNKNLNGLISIILFDFLSKLLYIKFMFRSGFQPVILKFINHVDFIVIGPEYVLWQQRQQLLLPLKYFTLDSPG